MTAAPGPFAPPPAEELQFSRPVSASLRGGLAATAVGVAALPWISGGFGLSGPSWTVAVAGSVAFALVLLGGALGARTTLVRASRGALTVERGSSLLLPPTSRRYFSETIRSIEAEEIVDSDASDRVRRSWRVVAHVAGQRRPILIVGPQPSAAAAEATGAAIRGAVGLPPPPISSGRPHGLR